MEGRSPAHGVYNLVGAGGARQGPTVQTPISSGGVKCRREHPGKAQQRAWEGKDDQGWPGQGKGEGTFQAVRMVGEALKQSSGVGGRERQGKGSG